MAYHRVMTQAWTRVALLALTLLLSWQLPLDAQTAPPREPSADDGRALAERFCSSCHLVGSASDVTVPTGPATFRWIANKPGQTAQRIADALIAPHPPMPDMQLSRAEIQDLIAYIDTMRTDRSTPLLPPPPGQKPKMPSPS